MSEVGAATLTISPLLSSCPVLGLRPPGLVRVALFVGLGQQLLAKADVTRWLRKELRRRNLNTDAMCQQIASWSWKVGTWNMRSKSLFHDL